ncbi:MAG: hypothetical protein ACJ8F7_10880 [Gemmataceae bacterium]
MTRLRLYKEETRPGVLPLICLVCGRPAVVHVPRTFSWSRPWASFILLVVLVFVCFPVGIALVLASVLQTRRMTVDCPLCARHRNYWAWRSSWVVLPLLVLASVVIALAILMMMEHLPLDLFFPVLLTTIVLLGVWTITAVLLSRSVIRPVEITAASITLDPVSPEFAEVVQRERKHGRVAPVKPDVDDDDWYDPYPTAEA